ncbi:unnamed protein product, partial [Enterobius vermicularis]|uniref:RICTOR_M domain-containing protein n=1 Tax=Enterobius vermicularis TaxID=51028 RepID=A0A0N4VJ84_ENTVE
CFIFFFTISKIIKLIREIQKKKRIVAQQENCIQLKEEVARLLNTICSFYKGRDYISCSWQRKELISSVLAALKSKKLSNYASEHMLAALQKLSIRLWVQKELISLGMFEWLVHYLQTNLNNFALEFGCALMLNLSLNPVSHSTASRIANHCTLKHLIISVASQMGIESALKLKMDRHHCSDDLAQIPQIFKVLRRGMLSSKEKTKFFLEKKNRRSLCTYLLHCIT